MDRHGQTQIDIDKHRQTWIDMDKRRQTLIDMDRHEDRHADRHEKRHAWTQTYVFKNRNRFRQGWIKMSISFVC